MYTSSFYVSSVCSFLFNKTVIICQPIWIITLISWSNLWYILRILTIKNLFNDKHTETITCINTKVQLTITAYQDWKTKGFNRHLLQVDHSHQWHSSDVTKRESQKFICPVVLLYPHSDLGITGVKVNKSFQVLPQDVGVHAASDLWAGGGHGTPGAGTKRGQALCCSVTVCKTREQNCYLLFITCPYKVKIQVKCRPNWSSPHLN